MDEWGGEDVNICQQSIVEGVVWRYVQLKKKPKLDYAIP